MQSLTDIPILWRLYAPTLVTSVFVYIILAIPDPPHSEYYENATISPVRTPHAFIRKLIKYGGNEERPQLRRNGKSASNNIRKTTRFSRILHRCREKPPFNFQSSAKSFRFTRVLK